MEATQLKINDPVVLNGHSKTLEKKYDHVCIVCNGGFKSSHKKSSYCSNSCRSKHNRSAKKTSLNMAPDTEAKEQQPRPLKMNGEAKGNNGHNGESRAIVGTPIFHGLSPQMQIAVDLLKQDSRRWEQLYSQEKEKRKKVSDKYETLREELATIKVDNKIAEIENKKTGGLEGLAENPLILKLVDHVGPALGALMLKLGDSSPSSQLIGTDGQLDEITSTQANEMVKWFTSLPADTRGVVYDVLTELAASKSIEVLNDTLLRIKNILKSGTVIMPYAGFGTIQ
jgi:hypothetical protein